MLLAVCELEWSGRGLDEEASSGNDGKKLGVVERAVGQ